MAPHLGSNPQNPIFRGANKHFQAKFAKFKNTHVIKTAASIPTKFYTTIKTTKRSLWVAQHAHNKFKTADSRHIEKNDKLPYLGKNSPQNLARLRILTLSTQPADKISNFLKFKMADGRHLEIEESRYLVNGLTAISTKFVTVMHIDSLNPIGR